MVGVHVADAEASEEVAGEGVVAQHHPGPSPDRYGGGARPSGGRGQRGPGGLGPVQPVGPGEPAAVDEDAVQFGEGLLQGADLGDQDVEPGRPERVEIGGPVLLLVGDHEVGGKGGDRCHVRVLRAADTGGGESRGVRAPVGDPDEQPGRGDGDGLGERGNQGDDAHGRAFRGEGGGRGSPLGGLATRWARHWTESAPYGLATAGPPQDRLGPVRTLHRTDSPPGGPRTGSAARVERGVDVFGHRDDQQPGAGHGGAPPVADAAGEEQGVAAFQAVDLAFGLDIDGALDDVHQFVVAVLELAPEVRFAAELQGAELMPATHQAAYALAVLGPDDVHGARGVGGGPQPPGGGLQRIGDPVEGTGAGTGALVLDLAEEGHGEAAARRDRGQRESQGSAPSADGGAHPRCVLVVHVPAPSRLRHPPGCQHLTHMVAHDVR
ncbi:putative regulatory protein [Streptomyces sp. W007]|nr:putative regulatory protein [Streptomyces sp. W007]